MRKISFLLTLLVASFFMTNLYGSEKPADAIQLQEKFRAVQRQMMQSGLNKQEGEALIQAMVQARFTKEQVTKAGQQLASESHSKVLAVAVSNKIYEGIAKNVSAEKILRATSRVRERYTFGLALASDLNVPNTDGIGRLMADCLAAGVTKEDAAGLIESLKIRVRQTTRNQNTQMLAAETAMTARDMARQGVSSETVLMVMKNALNHGYDVEGMQRMRHSFAGEGLQAPQETAERYGTAIGQGVAAQELSGLGGSNQGNALSGGQNETSTGDSNGGSGDNGGGGGNESGGGDGGGRGDGGGGGGGGNGGGGGKN